jgi:hypothetical protein
MLSTTAPARGQAHGTTAAIAQRPHHPRLPVRAADQITATAAKKPVVIKPSASGHSRIAGVSFTRARLLRFLHTPRTYPAHAGTNELSETAPDNPAVVRRLQRTCTRETGTVVLEYASEGQVVATGAAYTNRYISVLTIDQRKVTRWRDYLDPLAVFDALGWPQKPTRRRPV